MNLKVKLGVSQALSWIARICLVINAGLEKEIEGEDAAVASLLVHSPVQAVPYARNS